MVRFHPKYLTKRGPFLVRIHIIRHAQSEANIKEILAGQLDFPLTEKGKEDAKQIATWYSSQYKPQIIYCSPLLRAKQTAAPFRVPNSIPFIEDKRLVEQHLGIFQGKTYTEAEADPLYEEDRTKRWNWKVPEGESYQEIAKRIESFFSSLDPSQGDCLIVTHAVAMRMMKAVLENTRPHYPAKIAKNGEIWELEFKGVGHAHTITSLFAENLSYEEHNS